MALCVTNFVYSYRIPYFCYDGNSSDFRLIFVNAQHLISVKLTPILKDANRLGMRKRSIPLCCKLLDINNNCLQSFPNHLHEESLQYEVKLQYANSQSMLNSTLLYTELPHFACSKQVCSSLHSCLFWFRLIIVLALGK